MVFPRKESPHSASGQGLEFSLQRIEVQKEESETSGNNFSAVLGSTAQRRLAKSRGRCAKSPRRLTPVVLFPFVT